MENYESIFKDLENEILNVGVIPYKKLSKEIIAIMPIKEDIAIFIIKKNNTIGVNYSWGGFEFIKEAGILSNTIDYNLTKKVNWNGAPKDIIKSISNEVIKDYKEKDKNLSVNFEQLKEGDFVKFKFDSGKSIMNEWLSLSEKRGKITRIFKNDNNLEVEILLDEKLELLNEWDNSLIYIDEEITEDLLPNIILINENKENMKELNYNDKVIYLENFIKKWGGMENLLDETEQFQRQGVLQSEYDEFLTNNNLPSWSADELLSMIKKLKELEGIEVLVKEDYGSKVYKTKIKDVILVSEDDFTVENPRVNITVEDKPESANDFYSFLLNDVLNLISGKIAEGLDVEFNPDVTIFEQEEKTAFNDVDKFVEEYKDYLIGKKITNGIGDEYILSDVTSDNGVIILEGDGFVEHVFRNDAQSFIDGEELNQMVGYMKGQKFSLILQEEKPEENKMNSINNQGYKYFVVNPKTNKISSGWDYKEDAEDAAKEDIEFGKKDVAVFSKKTISSIGIDPDDDNSWYSNSDDLSIIDEAVKFGVTEGDYDEAMAKSYIDGYANGKYLTVIKARLVYYLEHADKHFRKAVVNSDYKKASTFAEVKTRIQNQLISIIRKDV